MFERVKGKYLKPRKESCVLSKTTAGANTHQRENEGKRQQKRSVRRHKRMRWVLNTGAEKKNFT